MKGLKSYMGHKVVFLDRDDTIVKHISYCKDFRDIELLPGAAEAIKLLRANGFKIIVVTNQSGIERGYFDREELQLIHNKMEADLASEGAAVDAIYYCPHLPSRNCSCRKPSNGLLLKASRDFNIDFKKSFMVGDMPMDINAGNSMGCKTVLLSNSQDYFCYPNHITSNLLEASKWIINASRIKTSIIIPAYNEERGLPLTLYKLAKVINDTYEVIVVDDGCTDNTLDALISYTYKVVKHQVNQGKGVALKEGIKEAIGEYIIWIDADDSYPPEHIPDMVKAFDEGYDAVVCSRRIGRRNIPIFNRIGNWIFKSVIRKFYGFTPYDPMTGLYGVKKKYLLKMKLTSKRFAIEPEISIKGARMGLKTLDIPAKYRVRAGRTKLNAIKVGWEDTITILSLVFWRSN